MLVICFFSISPSGKGDRVAVAEDDPFAEGSCKREEELVNWLIGG